MSKVFSALNVIITVSMKHKYEQSFFSLLNTWQITLSKTQNTFTYRTLCIMQHAAIKTAKSLLRVCLVVPRQAFV